MAGNKSLWILDFKSEVSNIIIVVDKIHRIKTKRNINSDINCFPFFNIFNIETDVDQIFLCGISFSSFLFLCNMQANL